jgi:molecular chaperone Hsp33
MSDLLIRAVCRPLSVRIVAAVTSGLCKEAARRHGTSPAVTCALGRGLTAGLILSTLSTGGERVTLQLQSDGPMKGLTVDAYDDGDVRGYPQVPGAWPDARPSGRLRLAGLVGRDGVVNVTRDLGLKDRYQGQTALYSGEVDEDVEAYLRESEQIPSALGCELVLDGEGGVSAAGGFLAQVMPGGNEELIHKARLGLRAGALYDLLHEPAVTAERIAAALLPDAEVELLDARALRFRCRCSRERIEAMLKTLPSVDLSEMASEGQAEITCNYCNEQYVIDADTILQLLEETVPKERN